LQQLRDYGKIIKEYDEISFYAEWGNPLFSFSLDTTFVINNHYKGDKK